MIKKDIILRIKSKKKEKSKYKSDFKLLRDFVNSFDPCGLIETGAPIDEYDCLTQQILSFLYNEKSSQEIKDLICDEINNHFEMPIPENYSIIFDSKLDEFISNIKSKFSIL